MKKIISILLILLLLTFTLSSCKKEKLGANIWYPLEGKVTTIDPQCANTADELLIVENTMEGLVRKDAKGTVIPGMANSWTISEDGLVYTFILRQNAKWDLNQTIKKMIGSDFDPAITAADFVFALQRACLPTTASPYFNSIASIAGATAVHSGQAAASALGVVAIDPYTLQITLSRADEQLLATLSSAIAMPCNAQYFEFTKGRYGLEKNYTLFNGPFYLSYWGDTQVTLKHSAIYKGSEKSVPGTVTLRIPETRESVLPNLLKGVYDAAIITGSESEQIPIGSNVTLTPFENKVWSYQFNCSDTILSNRNIRMALSYAVQSITTDQAYFTAPKGIIPASCNLNGKSYRDMVTNCELLPNDTARAISHWLAGLKELSPSELNLTILCPTGMEAYAKQGVQGIQKALGTQVNYINKNGNAAGLNLSIKIETAPLKEIDDQLRTGTYQIAFYPLTATDDNAQTFLNQFKLKGGYTNYNSPTLQSLLTRVEQTRDATTIAALLKQCEDELIQNGVLLPVLCESSFFAMGNGVSEIGFQTSGGRVNFIHAQQTK